MMAENECGMQRNLNLLNEYCNCNGLRVNISKTKMMVFATSKTRRRNLPTFKFGNFDLDLVDDYVYLGICFNWNGSFVKAKQLLHDKASKAMYTYCLSGMLTSRCAYVGVGHIPHPSMYLMASGKAAFSRLIYSIFILMILV